MPIFIWWIILEFSHQCHQTLRQSTSGANLRTSSAAWRRHGPGHGGKIHIIGSYRMGALKMVKIPSGNFNIAIENGNL